MRLLTVNAGSSSLRCAVLDGEDVVAHEHLRAPEAPGDQSAATVLRRLIQRHAPDASVHRIVHGGARFTEPVVVDGATRSALDELVQLAPLHNTVALHLLDEVRTLAPGLPSVACFDTAFFADLPDAASTYAICEDWRVRLGIRRFGFHGLSHGWVASVMPHLIAEPSHRLRIVSAHLGAGGSLAAIAGGRAVDTTMGFTPIDGLVMATRSGSLDPGAVTHLIRVDGLGPDEVEDGLEQRSGLLGLAGSADLGEVIEAAEAGQPRSMLAYGVYLHRLRGAIAAMTAAMGGLDVLCFTGGAGEASATLRAHVCNGLEFLGCQVDAERNAAASGDRVISLDTRPVIAVVHAREDLMMARQATTLLGPGDR